MGAGVSSSNVRLVTFNFFNGSPCLNVGHISQVRVFVVMVAIAATVTPVVCISPVVVLITARVASVVAVMVTMVVAAAVRVITFRRTLAFFATSLCPAVGLVVAEVVAVVTLDIALVTLLLRICGESFIRAVLALLHHAAVILVRDKTDNLIGCDGIASSVSCCVDTTNSSHIRGGERAKQDGCEFVVIQVLPHSSELLSHVDKPSEMSMSVVLVAQLSVL